LAFQQTETAQTISFTKTTLPVEGLAHPSKMSENGEKRKINIAQKYGK